MHKQIPNNPYSGLIGILILSLMLITAYSFCKEELSVGNFVLHKADISTHFSFKDRALPDTVACDSSDMQTTDTIVTDTTSQRILLFGDSMVEGLSKRMRNYAAQNNHELLNVIWYSSSTKIWSESDTLAYFIKQFEPTYLMLCLGGNELFVRDLDKRENYIRKIITMIGDRPYVWIGPPNWKEDTGICDLMEKHAQSARFFPSKKLTYERGDDGAHPTPASSARWMDSIAVWIMNETHYPIRMEFPQSNERKGKTIILKPLK